MSTPSQGFDITTAELVRDAEDEGQWIEVLDAAGKVYLYANGTGADKPVRMRVAGRYSRVFRRTQESQNAKPRRRYDVRDAARDLLELQAACVLEWEGFFGGGAPLERTSENVANVLQAAPWIRDQVVVAMEDHEGFSERS